MGPNWTRASDAAGGRFFFQRESPYPMKCKNLKTGMNIAVDLWRCGGFRQIRMWVASVLCGVLAVGGKAQECHNVWMNLSAPAYWSTEVPFADLLKSAESWRSTKLDAGAYNPDVPLKIDARGWVTSLNFDWVNGQQTATTHIMSSIAKNHFIDFHWAIYGTAPVIEVSFDGSAELQFFGTQESQIFFNASNKVWVTLAKGDSNFGMTIRKIIPTWDHPYPKNFRVVPTTWVQYATPGNEKYPFNPAFLDKLSPFKGVRFMNWMRVNTELEYPITGKQQAWKARWGDRAKVEDAFWSTNKGVPVEVCAWLCNTMDVDMWINVPHTATLAGARYTYPQGMADVLAAELKPQIKVAVEHSNEVWNSGVFLQYYDCSKAGYAQGLALPTPSWNMPWESLTFEQQWFAAMRYHSLRTQVIGGIFSSKLGPSRVSRVYGSAIPAGPSWTWKLMSLDNLAANIDVLAIAPYIARNYTDTTCDCSPWDPNCKSPNSNWCQVIGQSCCSAADPCWPNATLFGCKIFKFDNVVSLMQDIEADVPLVAQEVSLIREVVNGFGKQLWFYEFGQHLVTMADQWDNGFVNGYYNGQPGLFHQAQTYKGEWGGKGMKDVYALAIAQLSAAATNPTTPWVKPVMAHFVLASPHDKSGRWGSLQHIFEDSWQSTAPKFQALTDAACKVPAGGIGG